MLWLIIPLAAVVVLFFSGFRKSAGALLVAAVVSAVVLYGLENVQDKRTMDRIAMSEIALQEVALRRTFDATYELTGRITNKSEKYRIDGISVQVRLSDCRSTGVASCEDLGEESAQVQVTVPPQQTRNLVATFYFGKEHTKPKGSLEWRHEITAIRASLP